MVFTKKEYKKGWVNNSLKVTRQHADIQSSMLNFGYDEAKLGKADNLMAEVQKWDNLHKEHLGQQKKSTHAISKAKNELNSYYHNHLKIARVALEGHSELWDLLMMEGQRKQSLAGWLEQVKAFYHNYERVAELLSQYTITSDIVEQCKAMIEAIEAHSVQQYMSRSHAQEATQQSRKYGRELDKWMSEFMYVAKLALKDSPQYLEALGKTVK